MVKSPTELLDEIADCYEQIEKLEADKESLTADQTILISSHALLEQLHKDAKMIRQFWSLTMHC